MSAWGRWGWTVASFLLAGVVLMLFTSFLSWALGTSLALILNSTALAASASLYSENFTFITSDLGANYTVVVAEPGEGSPYHDPCSSVLALVLAAGRLLTDPAVLAALVGVSMILAATSVRRW